MISDKDQDIYFSDKGTPSLQLEVSNEEDNCSDNSENHNGDEDIDNTFESPVDATHASDHDAELEESNGDSTMTVTRILPMNSKVQQQL